jgi:hypothetical protein
VLDIFSGSNTTGWVAEELGRNWVSVELNRESAVLSATRFMDHWDEASIRSTFDLLSRAEAITLKPLQAHLGGSAASNTTQQSQDSLFQP